MPQPDTWGDGLEQKGAQSMSVSSPRPAITECVHQTYTVVPVSLYLCISLPLSLQCLQVWEPRGVRTPWRSP